LAQNKNSAASLLNLQLTTTILMTTIMYLWYSYMFKTVFTTCSNDVLWLTKLQKVSTHI